MNFPVYSSLTLKVKVKDVDDFAEIGMGTYFLTMHVCAKMLRFYVQLFAAIFRGICTDTYNAS